MLSITIALSLNELRQRKPREEWSRNRVAPAMQAPEA
jgi:hypothetical protein